MIVPRGAGVGSALGLLVAERRIDQRDDRAWCAWTAPARRRSRISPPSSKTARRTDARRMPHDGELSVNAECVDASCRARATRSASSSRRCARREPTRPSMRTAFYERYNANTATSTPAPPSRSRTGTWSPDLRGDARRACGTPSSLSASRTSAVMGERLALLSRRRAAWSRARSLTAMRWRRATASSGRRWSRSESPPPSCCPATSVASAAHGNLVIDIGASAMRRIDPVTLTVVWNNLVSIADEMGVALRRTAFSEAVREGDDFSTGLFDRHGPADRAGQLHPGPSRRDALRRAKRAGIRAARDARSPAT